MTVEYKGLKKAKVRFNKNSFVVENDGIKIKVTGASFEEWLNDKNNFLVRAGENKAVVTMGR